MAEPVIEVKDLTKTFQVFSRREGVFGSVLDLFNRNYRALTAVDNISFSVQPGELIGYIGPNGAGKSTSIKMLTGILRPTSGKVQVLGHQPFLERREYTKKIGAVFGQRTQLWWDIAVIESFKLLKKIYKVSDEDFKQRLDELSDILALHDLLNTPARKLSLGQRIRCDLCASLLHAPRVIFLDEPTIGLDAVAKDSVRAFLKRINKEFNTTIILTTHDLREIEELCERIIVIDKGRLVYDGDLESIKSLSGLEREVQIDFVSDAPLEQLNSKFSGKLTFTKKSQRRLSTMYDPEKIPTLDLLRGVVSEHEVADVIVHDPDIEDVIMKIYRDGVSA